VLTEVRGRILQEPRDTYPRWTFFFNFLFSPGELKNNFRDFGLLKKKTKITKIANQNHENYLGFQQ
jgi:hypothetical protein